jgi:hypothetical protein
VLEPAQPTLPGAVEIASAPGLLVQAEQLEQGGEVGGVPIAVDVALGEADAAGEVAAGDAAVAEQDGGAGPPLLAAEQAGGAVRQPQLEAAAMDPTGQAQDQGKSDRIDASRAQGHPVVVCRVGVGRIMMRARHDLIRFDGTGRGRPVFLGSGYLSRQGRNGSTWMPATTLDVMRRSRATRRKIVLG